MNKLYLFSFLLLIFLFYYGFQLDSDMPYSKEIMTGGLTLSILSLLSYVIFKVKSSNVIAKNEDFHSENRLSNNRETDLRSKQNEKKANEGNRLEKAVKSTVFKKETHRKENVKSEKKEEQTIPSYLKDKINRKITEGSTRAMTNVYSKAIQTMMGNSCPCHYPRFRKFIAVHEKDKSGTPTFCVDANFLIQAATNTSLGFLTPVEQDDTTQSRDSKSETIYACTKCDTIYKEITLPFKGNVKRLRLDTMVPNFKQDVGAKLVSRFPVFQGFFSDDDSNLSEARKSYYLGEEKEVFLHLVKQ